VGSDDSAESLFRRIIPSLIVVGTSENPRTLGLDLINLGRKSGIVTIGIVDGTANASWRFAGTTNNPLAFAPDWIFVPDEITREEYLALGFDRDSIVNSGHPNYDSAWKARQELEVRGRDSVRAAVFPSAQHRRVLTFVAEVSTGLNPLQYLRDSSYTLHGRGTSNGRTEIVVEELVDALGQLCLDLHCVLRLHPKNNLEELSPYYKYFQQISQDEMPYDVVFSSDLVVGMTSHLLLESAILGRATLSVLPRAVERKWLPTIAFGITTCVLTREDLRSFLFEWAQSPEKHAEAGNLENLFRFGAIRRTTQLLLSAAKIGTRTTDRLNAPQ
jgi:hypothetical protein